MSGVQCLRLGFPGLLRGGSGVVALAIEWCW
jgi:hypothetical protein